MTASSAIYVVNTSGISPVRKEPSDRAEMLTQMLLGETALVKDITERWLHLKLDFDGYEGWVNRNEVRFLPEKEMQDWMLAPSFRNRYASVKAPGVLRPVFVPVGARLGIQNTRLFIPGEVFEPVVPDDRNSRSPLDYAAGFLGVPYLWGGRTDTGIDCSGLVQTSFLLAGFKMPRDAWQQHALGFHRAGGMAAAKPGDLIYFGSEGRITHVGFYEGAGTLLHAQGCVKRENLMAKVRFQNPNPLNLPLFEKLMSVQDGESLIVSLEISAV